LFVQDRSSATAMDGMEMQRLTAGTAHPNYQGQVVAESANGSSKAVTERRLCGHSLFDVLSVAGCAFNMATKGTIGVFETLGLVYVTTHYDWSSLQSGVTFSVAGSLGVLSLLMFSLLLRLVSDVNLVLGGMLVMTASCLIFSIGGLFSGGGGLPLWAFYAAIGMMYSVGYPVGHTALIGIFSKLVKTGPQGRILGLFGSAGSLARIVFPLLAGLLTELYGDRVIFAVMAVVLGVSCGVFAYFKAVIQEYVDI
jgi:MFS family permease